MRNVAASFGLVLNAVLAHAGAWGLGVGSSKARGGTQLNAWTHWRQHRPKIKLMPTPSRRQPYPLSWDEQAKLFAELPAHLAQMALFAVNTGCRDAEICGLRWEWEVEVPAMCTSALRSLSFPERE